MVEIKMATKEDAQSILEITHQAFLKYLDVAKVPDTPALHEQIENVISDIENKLVYVAVFAGEVVGSVRITLKDDNTAYLSRFGVTGKYQNLGVGKALIDAVDTDMVKRNIKSISLHTASKAFSLVHFYYKRGFYIDSTSKDKGYVRAEMIKEY